MSNENTTNNDIKKHYEWEKKFIPKKEVLGDLRNVIHGHQRRKDALIFTILGVLLGIIGNMLANIIDSFVKGAMCQYPSFYIGLVIGAFFGTVISIIT